MKIGKIALIGGAMIVTLGGMGLAACSSSDTPTPNPANGQDSGTPANGQDSGNPNPGADTGTNPNPGTDSGPGPGTDGGTCKNPTLHPGTAGDIFCGYNDAGSFNCSTGNQCCLGGKVGSSFDPEVCVGFGTQCTNPAPTDAGGGGLPIQCGQVADCNANGQTGAACCLVGSGAPALVAGCTYYKAQGGSGVVCEGASDAGAAEGGAVPACAAGEVQICSDTKDCPAGKTCTAMKWKLYDMGFCQ